ncbi:MAG: hypothetical protein ACI9TH_000844 [Kiritimatiellia bacterium]|jgi:hypothetical protein
MVTKTIPAMKIRPTFELTVAASPEEVAARMGELKATDQPCDASVLKSYAVLRIPAEHQHYWSPQLNVEWHESPEGSQIKGRFGPRPSVWTLFAGFYLLSIFAGLMGLIFGLAQRQLHLPAWALWSVPVAAFGLALAYGIARYGQQLGHAQMDELHARLRKVLRAE